MTNPYIEARDLYLNKEIEWIKGQELVDKQNHTYTFSTHVYKEMTDTCGGVEGACLQGVLGIVTFYHREYNKAVLIRFMENYLRYHYMPLYRFNDGPSTFDDILDALEVAASRWENPYV